MTPCTPAHLAGGPDESNTADDVELLKNYIRHCPYVNKDSPAIAAALSGLSDSNDVMSNQEKLVSSPATTKKTPSSPTQKKIVSGFFTLLRFVLLDSPLMLIVGGCLFLFWVNHVHDNYLVPQIKAAEFTEERATETDLTYYTRPCFTADMSTMNGEDLFLDDTATPEEAYQHQLRHGFTVFPHVLSDETVRDLRQHIDSRNRNLTEAESNYVIAGENRFSFGLGTETPSVAKAMSELTSNERLKASVEKIMGKNPALIEMTAITSSYGAIAQTWHDDVVPEGSPVQYARAFGPSYSIFVVLQNTTKSMGATDACPGLHMCAAGPLEEVCQENGFQLVGEHGYWRAGDALLMNMNSWHRGAAHTDPDAPDRVMLILTWVPQPQTHAESRQMSQGITFSLRWDMWGHTWYDLMNAATVMTQPWATLRALGLYKPENADWGVDYVSGASMRIANNDNGFQNEELIDFVKRDGGFKFLPSWLHGYVGDDEETSWHEFLVDTLGRCKKFMTYVSAGAVGGYVLLYFLISLVSIGLDGNVKSGLRRFGRALFRLAIMISIVFVLYRTGIKHVDNTQWASDLRHGLRYTSPFGNEESAFDGPTTFPHRNDALIVTRYKSDYLAMYNDYVGNHPGNRVWNELIDEKASTFASYSGLPSRFSTAVAEYIVGALYNNAGRFLYQNEVADFVNIGKRDAVAQTKQELTTKSNSIRSSVVTQVEYLMSEAKYGHLRHSVMTTKYTFPFLVELQSKLLGYSSQTKKSKSIVRSHPKAGSSNSQQFQLLRTAALSALRTRSKPTRRPVTLQVGKLSRSPYAYLQSGEIVEAKLTTKGATHWYKAEVEDVLSTGEVSLVYLHSDTQEDTHHLRVREYIPPKVGEIVDVKVDHGYKKGTILLDKGDGLFDVKVAGKVLEDQSDDSFRRKE